MTSVESHFEVPGEPELLTNDRTINLQILVNTKLQA
jgi:hypothetical protein